jgi:hypothetical protein
LQTRLRRLSDDQFRMVDGVYQGWENHPDQPLKAGTGRRWSRFSMQMSRH